MAPDAHSSHLGTVSLAESRIRYALSLEASDIFHPVIGIVEVPSLQLPTMLRVKAGDSDNSYLIQHLWSRPAPSTVRPVTAWITVVAHRLFALH